MNITGVNALQGVSTKGIGGVSKAESGVNFSDFMNEALNKVSDLQKESSTATEQFISGESDNIHTVMITGAKADLALQMTLQVRNQVMEAYKEIMNMQI